MIGGMSNAATPQQQPSTFQTPAFLPLQQPQLFGPPLGGEVASEVKECGDAADGKSELNTKEEVCPKISEVVI